MYDKYLITVKERESVKKKAIENKKKDSVDYDYLGSSILLQGRKKKEYTKDVHHKSLKEPVMKITEYMKVKITLMLLDSSWNFLINDSLTLEEIGELFDLSRERVRQIERSAATKFKNLSLLKQLNINNEIETILEIAYGAVKRKNKELRHGS